MKRPAKYAALMVLGVLGAVGCRDWDRFEPAAGGGDPVGGSNTGAGNVGAGDVGGAPEGAGNQGGAPVGGGPVGGSTPETCGKIDILSDDFEQPLDWRWTADTYFVSVSGGDLVVPHPVEESYYQIETSAGFDFRGRTMVFEVSTPPSLGGAVWLNVAGDRDNYLEFYLNEDGVLGLGYEKNDNYFNFVTMPFDPVAHRFMRFREDAGECFYDVSPDGTTWDELGSWQLDDVWDPEFTFVYIGGYYDGVTAPGAAMHIARVYAEDPQPSEPCPASILTDDFDDGAKSSAWYQGWQSSVCPIGEMGGRLTVSCPNGGDESSGYVSSSAYDLAGSSVSLEVIDHPESGSDGYMGFGVSRPEADTFYQFEINDGSMNVYETIDDSWDQVASVDYDPVASHFMRIREAGGTVFFETSPDGADYTTFHSRPAAFSLAEVLVFAMGGAYMATAPVDIAWDNLNITQGGAD